jgi:hypothetical protein
MRSIFKLALVAAAALATASPALAESLTIPAGKPSHLGFWHTYNQYCSYGSKPTFRITKAPEHGTVTASWTAYKMGEDTRNCKGKYVKGMLITYTPHKGYRGEDVLKFTLSGSGVHPGASLSLGRGFRYDLTIK